MLYYFKTIKNALSFAEVQYKDSISKKAIQTKKVFYSYYDIGQLIRENNELLGITYVYGFDRAGNIGYMDGYSYTEGEVDGWSYIEHLEFAYNYGTSWGDLMTSWYGDSNEFDEIGNPLNLRGGDFTNLTWEGRRLISGTKSNVQFAFTYNDEGIRTSKTVGGVEHKYTLNGTQILSEQWEITCWYSSMTQPARPSE